mmetsp:Transcript_34588/g.67711  ORF Transcript_34588/g.67711 Transcript_34588/m.67711 type:complete len:121 (-) Transcript_34588:891-1253(-)
MSASMGGATGGARVQVRPPEKGSFPLDHFQECKDQMMAYMKCMKDGGGDHANCKEATKAYLTCRMDNGLMTRENLSNFGLDVDVDLAASKEAQRKHVAKIDQKRDEGYVAGLGFGVRREK